MGNGDNLFMIGDPIVIVAFFKELTGIYFLEFGLFSEKMNEILILMGPFHELPFSRLHRDLFIYLFLFPLSPLWVLFSSLVDFSDISSFLIFFIFLDYFLFFSGFS